MPIKFQLPHVKSAVSIDNKNSRSGFLSKLKELEKSNSSLNITKYDVKNIYVTLDINPKKTNIKFLKRMVFLRGVKRKKINNNEEYNKSYSISKGKEYTFNQEFDKVFNININHSESEELLNDKGTLISFHK